MHINFKFMLTVISTLIFLGSMSTFGGLHASALNPIDIGSKLSNSSDTFIAQKTEMSNPASPAVTPQGKIPHQIVFGLPLRDDGKIWTGVITFTASKPIEIEVLHDYYPKIVPDTEHGEPYHAILPVNNSGSIVNRSIAISTMTMFTDTPVRVTDTPISTGSFVFTGSAVVFHKTSGEPFTVTYTVDAVAKSPNH